MNQTEFIGTQAVPKYINPLTDYGFKRIFGNEAYKDLLIDFLNELLSEQGKIIDLNYLNPEQLGNEENERKVIFDIYCKTDCGKYFIVEMQKVRQAYFKDRSIYYSTSPIQAQAVKGIWDFKLNAVFTVSIVDFILFNDEDEKEHYYHDIRLMEEKTGKVFYDKLVYKYLELPKFTKSLEELETNFERWVYLLKTLPRFENRPSELKGKIFDKLFQAAEVSRLTSTEMREYNKSIEEDAFVRIVMEQHREEGERKGIEKGIERGIEKGVEMRNRQMAINCLHFGLSIEDTSKLTGLSVEDIAKLNISPFSQEQVKELI